MKNWKKWKPLCGFLPAVLCIGCILSALSGYSTTTYPVQIDVADVTVTDEANTTKIATDSTYTTSTSAKAKASATTVVKLAEAEETGTYQDGVYIGTGTGYGGTTTVQVTISNGEIVDITILSHNDDEPYITNASALLEKIIETQSTNVDVVSGATYSSNSLIEAVRNALAKAGGTALGNSNSGNTTTSSGNNSAVSIANVSDSGDYVDSVYLGTGTGFGGELTVQVTISDRKISEITLLQSNDDEPYITNATALLQNIISLQTTNVDTVSRVTYSSNDLIEAVRNALSKATSSSSAQATTATASTQKTTTTTTKSTKITRTAATNETAGNFPYDDGIYTGTGEGYRGDITVSVTLENGYLTAVEIISSEDDEPYFSNATTLIQTILDEQSTQVDAVSGATYSSNGIIDAVTDALETAKSASTKATTTTKAETTATTGTASTTHTETQTTAVTATVLYADGTYEGTAICYPNSADDFEAYTLSLQITIEGSVITSISNVTGSGSNYDSENNWYINRAVNGTSKYIGVTSQILESSSTAEIDAVSGATCSSDAIVVAVENALTKASLGG